MKKIALAIIATSTLPFGSTAKAALTIYTDRASWEAAVTSISVENFNSFSSDTAANSAIFNGFTTSAFDVLVDVPAYEYNPGSGDIDGTPRLNFGGILAESPVSLNLTSAVSAVGFDTVNYDFNNEQLLVWINGSEFVGYFPSLRDETGFLGVVSDSGEDITSVVFTAADGTQVYNALDNFSTAAAIPEPAAASCLLGGSALAFFASRKRRV